MNIKLVCLTSGKKKNGTGNWYKATLLSHNAENKPVTKDFFLPEELGERMIRNNIIEDVPVSVTLGFDNYFNPSITGITRAGANTASNKEAN